MSDSPVRYVRAPRRPSRPLAPRPWHVVYRDDPDGTASAVRSLCHRSFPPESEIRAGADMGVADRMHLCTHCAQGARSDAKKAAGVSEWVTRYRTTRACPHCTGPLLSVKMALSGCVDAQGRPFDRLRCRDCARRYRFQDDRLHYTGRGDRPRP